jgi:hypothetical protein
MESSTRSFSIEDQPEVFATTTETSAAVRRAVAAGTARKLGGRLYTRNVADPLEQVVRRNWQPIAAHYFPGAVIVDRSAIDAKPAEDGSLFLDAGPEHAGRRNVRLPGLTIKPRRGPGPASGDMPFMDGLHFSGWGRRMLDNLRPARRRGDGVARTLSRSELEEELTRTVAVRGADALNELRDRAAAVAPEIEAEHELKVLDDLIGAILGTREAQLESSGARASATGAGFDARRIELFEILQAELLRRPHFRREEQAGPTAPLSFFEAYFSNWIEGTEFELEEAREIVFERAVPAGRTEDAHDVLGTFEVVNDPHSRVRTPSSGEELTDLLRSHHSRILERRPNAQPGEFKTRSNQAGNKVFVHPDLTAGTLNQGFRFYDALPPGFARAVFMMFLVSEVHPFVDGNGRVGRVMMNADLTAAGEQRILIPLSYRDDYLGGLRALSRGADPRPLVRVLDYAQDYASRIDWSDVDTARVQLEATNALVPPDEAEERGARLVLPPQ